MVASFRPSSTSWGECNIPIYDFTCKKCGTYERRAGYEDATVTCDTCEGTAARVQVYRQNLVVDPAMPPRENMVEVQGALDTEMRKIGWDGDRAVDELRHAFRYNEQGQGELDMSKMSKTASKRGTDVD